MHLEEERIFSHHRTPKLLINLHELGFIIQPIIMPSINSDLRHLTEMSDEKRRSMVESSIGPEAMRLSKQLQAMLQKEEGEIIRVETERINAVLREHEELYPPYTEDCPLSVLSLSPFVAL